MNEDEPKKILALLAVMLVASVGALVYGGYALRDAIVGHGPGPAEAGAEPAQEPPGLAEWFFGDAPRERPNNWREVRRSPFVHAPLAENDPQTLASRRSYGDRGDSSVPPFYPTARVAHVVTSDGNSGVSVGSQCEVRVLPVLTSSFNCLVRVKCDGVILYPDASQEAGYAPCDALNGSPVRAHDGMFTGADGDPLLDFDVETGRVVISDGDTPESPRFTAVLQLSDA